MTDKQMWVRSLDYAGPGVPETAAFYRELWKLTDVESNRGDFLRGTGPEPYILGLHSGQRRGLVRISIGVDSEATLAALHAKVTKAGQTPTAIVALDTPGGGVGFDLRDPDNRTLRFTADVAAVPVVADPDAPIRISHIVLNTPQMEKISAFFTAVVGFRISDWSEDQMVFLRCNSDHHSIALVRADRASVNHVAFELPNLDSYMRGIGRLKAGGYPVNWGPGRHGPGDNPFAYYIGPSGFVIEYTTQLEQINEATHQPRVWQRTPEQSDRWMLAGPPSRQIRTAMAGDPDAGVQDYS